AREGAPAAVADPLDPRAPRWATGTDAVDAARPAQGRAAEDPGSRRRDGRRDPALRSRPSRVRRRRLCAPRSGPPSADLRRRELGGRQAVAGGAPAVRSRALQRVSRAARGGRQVELPGAAAVRGLRAALRSARAPPRRLLTLEGTSRSE